VTHELSSTEGRTSQDTRRKNERARSTHFLSSAEEGTSQDANRKRESKGYSLPVEPREADMLGHQGKVRNRGGLTLCRAQGTYQDTSESERARDTHSLLSTERGIC